MDQAEESKWEPNRDFLRQLMEMGFSRLAAEQVKFFCFLVFIEF